jgi:protein TonB
VGGSVDRGAAGPSAPPIPARERDLASVRERIARALVYPEQARRMRWQGRVFLAFVLAADGTVLELRVASSSGVACLDEAALQAVERAAPFPPPGVAVRIETPVSFRLR